LDGPILERFFRPFLGGIFLETDLVTTSRLFEFVFRMFGVGDAALPAQGMGALAEQLVSRLPTGTLRTGTRVASVDDGAVTLDSGERLHARAIVVATEGREASRLLGTPPPAPGRAVTCLYFAAPRPPVVEPILVLDGSGQGPVNNVCVPSVVSPEYAPGEEALVSASVLGDPAWDDEELETHVRRQLRGWFGRDVDAWRVLRTYRIREALPDQRPGQVDGTLRPVQMRPGLFVCGDHCESGSLQSALASGRRAAETLRRALGA
jgi:phytoene dehydrogenase-like protein